jgi:hypothetical protein
MNQLAFNSHPISTFEREKLEHDVFYSSMFKAGFDYSALQSSGWLNHSYSYSELLHVMNSQTSFIPHYSKNKEISIILNTGSYAPAHNGHISMLKMTQNYLKSKGLITQSLMVLSPSHDKYVLTKSKDIEYWNIDNRIEHLYKLIDQYPYFDQEDNFIVDNWESVYCNTPVNFTDVINKYVYDLHNQDIQFKIYYVFGSDNEQFLHAFSHLPDELKKIFFGVCVRREGYPTIINSNSSNIIYIDNLEEHSSLKSREIRSSISISDNDLNKIVKKGFYAIREDKEIALSQWIDKYPQHKEHLLNQYTDFHNSLKNIIHKYLDIDTLSIYLSKQKEILSSIAKNKNILNLDLGTNQEKSIDQKPLNLGRIFNPSSRQHKPLSMIKRPDKFTHFYPKIEKGEYVFVDDDIASGQTFNLLKKTLSFQDIHLIDKVNLTQEYCHCLNIDYHLFDIVDTKDFLLGTYTGGLICEFFGCPVRVPYFSNYVNLNTRANIPYSKLIAFNEEILNINKIFFQKNMFLTVQDISLCEGAFNILDVIHLNFSTHSNMPLYDLIVQYSSKKKG